MRFPRYAALILVGSSFLASPPSFGQATPAVPAIRVPELLRKKGGKIRIKNAVTGKAKVIDLADEEFISSDAVRELMDPSKPQFKPEFSVLDFEHKGGAKGSRAGAGGGMNSITRSLVFDQPVWREVTFKAMRAKSGAIVFLLDEKTGKVVPGPRVVRGGTSTAVTSLPLPSPEEAARRRNLLEGSDVKKLFDIGWRAINAKRYDLAFIAFGKLTQKEELLNAEQSTQAHLGRGLSRFHQEGCAKIEEDFRVAERNPANRDDISYFRGLCHVEAKRYREADSLFKDLGQKKDSKYAESARFFVGVVAENEERYGDAEAAYMDTIDFAQDQALVTLAKARLENAKQLRIQQEFASKWLLLALTASGGWESNAVSLPRDLAPSAYGVSKASSAVDMGLVYAEIKPPWTRAADFKIKYTGLLMHYLTKDVADSFDIQSHELGMSVGFTPTEKDSVGLGISYNSVFKKTDGTFGELLATPGFQFDWTQVNGPADNPSSDFNVNFKAGLVRPRTKPAGGLETVDPTANSYLLAWRYNIHAGGGETYGPGVDLEYRPSVGSENSYYSATLLGKWDQPVGPEAWELYTSQEFAFSYTPYYESEASRKDWVAKYTGSVAKLVTGWMEARLQGIATVNHSSVSTNTFNKFQINLLLSAFF